MSDDLHFFYVEEKQVMSFDGFLFLINNWNEVDF